MEVIPKDSWVPFNGKDISPLLVRAGILSRQHELNLANGSKSDTLELLHMVEELKALDRPTAKEIQYLNLFEDYLDEPHICDILNSKGV